MDELLHHCLRELSFDGDLGCNVSRLKDFIVGFYAYSGTVQKLDDAFCAFVWHLIVQQPSVRIGTLPPDLSAEIWVAPQTSAKRKAIAKGQGHVETKPAELEAILNSQSRTLDELKQEYGDLLRIAVHPDVIYASITGSHIRFAKMSPMVYSALQIITRGRDEGITVVELGQKSGYDQKTCFYLVRQLTDLNLVVKVRRGGVGTHFVIHKYFFDRSPSWKAIRDEEDLATDPQHTPLIQSSYLLEEEERESDVQPLHFPPIDARHLSSLALIRGRVVKLLRASRNQMHASQNMLITLGFSNPTKTDRRFFQSGIREMIQQGTIEKVVVPSSGKKTCGATVKCFRLVCDGNEKTDDSVIVQPLDGDEDERENDQSGVKMNITIHKQVFDLLEESNTSGMSLNELSAALGQFDKRTIELLLARAEKFPPPPHLGDLGIAGLMETSGRERRHRYFTIASYHELINRENLGDTTYPAVESADVGDFLPVNPDSFFDDETILFRYQDSFKSTEKIKGDARRRPFKNPILPDGSVKQGRPRKHPVEEGSKVSPKKGFKRKRAETINQESMLLHPPAHDEDRPTKRKRENSLETGVKRNVAKKRGRPSKEKPSTSIPDETCSVARPHKRRRLLEPYLDPNCTLLTSEGTPKAPGGQQFATSARYAVARDEPLGRLPPEILPTERMASSTVMEIPASPPDVSRGIPGIGFEKPRFSLRQGGSVDHPDPSHLREVGHVPIDPTLVLEMDRIDPHHTPGETSLGSPLTPLSDQILFETPGREIRISREKSETPGVSRAQPSTKIRESRVNVSHLRRENELYRVVQSMGGIVNIQTKDFYDEHMKLIDAMARGGEPTSGPVGTRTDKRTAMATFDALERQGRVKQLKTSIVTPTGVRRPACIVYLLTTDSEILNNFLAELAHTTAAPHPGNFIKIDEHVEYGADPNSAAKGTLPLQLLQMEEPQEDRRERWSKNMARARQLFSYDDAVIRQVLLTERTTVAQLYGFIVGKAIRLRELHLLVLNALEKTNQSPYVVSHEFRIVDLSFFSHEIPLGLYCSLVSTLSYNEELSRFIATDSGRMTLVKNLPQSLQFALQIGRSRGRSRFLDLLETLRALRLVTPLQIAISETPFITFTTADGRSLAFDVAPLDGWTVNTPMAAPVYWLFSDIAPIHIWAASEISPPFWQDVSLTCVTDAIAFWSLLEQASLHTDGIIPNDSDSVTGPLFAEISVARSLRRNVSWSSDYILTWHQMQFIKRFIDSPTAATPLQDEDGGTPMIERISWVISAPRASIERFCAATREKLLKDMERVRKKSTRRQKRGESTKASLAKKAAEAHSQREEQWNNLINRLLPTTKGAAVIARIDRIRARFLQANSVKRVEKWEEDVTQALQETDLVKTSTVTKWSLATRPVPVSMDVPLTIINNPPEKSVEALIAMQGPPVAHDQEKEKRKRRKDSQDELPKVKTSRRHRFQWNRDYEELARDASVIIKARCRNLPRLDWAAFEQVFPAVPRNTVRQRLAHIRETPGNEAYLCRLEDRWYDLWMQHRGTALLPDDDPASTSNFNLIKHIEFLRRHIDKNAIRVGFVQSREEASGVIPVSVDEVPNHFDIMENAIVTPPWDFVWNAVVEEGREKRMLRQPFLNKVNELPCLGFPSQETICLAESAVKMAMGTPHERYEPAAGAALLHSVGEHHVSTATKNLLSRGILSKLVRDPQRQQPGRQLKISEGNQNSVGGPIPRDTFQDAAALEEISLHDAEWREWPLLATDGDLAALVQLVSEERIEFKIDTSLAQLARPALDWNSKKADDDQIETSIYIRTTFDAVLSPPSYDGSVQSSPAIAAAELPTCAIKDDTLSRDQVASGPSHGQCSDGGAPSCRQLNGMGVFDCTGCLAEEWTSFSSSLTLEENDLARSILDVVRAREEHGITKAELWDVVASGRPRERVSHLLSKMTDSSVPVAFWTGYSSIVLVSSVFLKHWTVTVSDNPIMRIFPRRWFDTSGLRVQDFWDSALKAVLGLVFFRPGITQAELRWRLRAVYDRQELGDVVKWLHDEGYLKMRVDSSVPKGMLGIGALDNQEEQGVFWFISEEKHWYQVS